MLADYWSRFAQQYASDPTYWYVPKGKAITPAGLEVLRSQLKILKGYEGKNWRASQGRFTRDLVKRKLFRPSGKAKTEGDETAISRMLKRVFDLLGLAWVDNTSTVYITDAGNRFIKARDLAQFVQRQLFKYQLWNPSLDRKFAPLRLFPHVFLLRVLLAFPGGISRTEYELFVCRTKHPEDLTRCLENIRRYRALRGREQDKLVDLLDSLLIDPQPALPTLEHVARGTRRTSMLNTIRLNSPYAINFLAYPGYVKHDGDTIVVKAADARGVRTLVQDHEARIAYTDFAGPKDWFAMYGDYGRDGTYIDALEYYTDRSDLEKAEPALRAAKAKGLLRDVSPKQYMEEQISEKILEEFLEYKLQALDSRLTLLPAGRQYQTLVGPIDLLAKDKNGSYVVIELKKGRAADRVFGQLCRYMGWVGQHLKGAKGKPVRGIIVGAKIDAKLMYAIRASDPARYALKEFKFLFQFSDKFGAPSTGST
jgi:hypothetical protein